MSDGNHSLCYIFPFVNIHQGSKMFKTMGLDIPEHKKPSQTNREAEFTHCHLTVIDRRRYKVYFIWRCKH